MILTSKHVQALLAVALLLGMANVSSAVLLVYEPFDYADGAQLYDHTAMTGLNGGGGFGAAWTGRNNQPTQVPAGTTSIQAASLAHPMGGVPTQGGSVLISGELGTTQPARTFSPFALNAISNAETSGGSLWISFLAQRQGEALTGVANPYPRGVNVSLFDAATLNDEKTGVGNSSGASDNTWSIVPDGSGGAREGAYDPAGGVAGGGPDNVGATTFPFEELQWAVVRIDYAGAGGNQDMYLWLSPDPTSVPDTMDADAAVLGDDTNFRTLLGIGGLRPFVGALDTNADPDRPFGVLAWDEFRVGTSFADMTSTTVIPEPTSLVLVALGCCLAGLARRRNG